MSFGETVGSVGLMVGIECSLSMIGPLFGSILFQIGGYNLPFLFFGIISFVISLLILIIFLID